MTLSSPQQGGRGPQSPLLTAASTGTYGGTSGTGPTLAPTHAEVHLPCVSIDLSFRFAYAYIEPECADPGHFIQRVLEERTGNPPHRLAASSRGAMLVFFPDSYIRAPLDPGAP